MKNALLILCVISTLAACAPAQPTMTNMQNTAIAIVQTGIALTQTALPTSTPEATATPTQPIVPLLTPDAIQVERWREYQTELAMMVLYHSGTKYQTICEWDILGRSDQEVYVWAVCGTAGSGNNSPAVIYLEKDGSIQKVEIPVYILAGTSNKSELFPADTLEKIDAYSFSIAPFHSERALELMEHLNYRLTNPEEPPLIFIDKIPTPTPSPTLPVIPILTPDMIQVTNWREYQAKLSKAIICDGYVCSNHEVDLCEWDILKRSGQDVYVWAICYRPGYAIAEPALIHLNNDGSIKNVEAPTNGPLWKSDVLRLFPTDLQTAIKVYSFSERETELTYHLFDRTWHPEEPPLLVLSIIPTATPTP